MTFFKEGDNPQPSTPATKCYAFTFGVRLANGQVTPCTVQGQKAEFVFNDTVSGIDTVPNGFGVGLMSKTHSGGIGVPVLAGGAITQGHDIVVGMVEFELSDGATVELPVAIDVDDAADGDWIVGKASLGSSATEADTDVNAPSIALESYDIPQQVVGAADASNTFVITLPIQLAAIAGNGDVVTDWTPDFSGSIISSDFQVSTPVTTAAKAATLNIEIDGVDVTGGVIALTSANATPLGKVISGTAITAGNAFEAGETVSIEASGVTAFVEGAGNLILTVRAAA